MSPSRNEQTSKRIATLAGKGLQAWQAFQKKHGKTPGYAHPSSYNFAFELTYGQIASIIASAATQSPSRPSQKGTTQKRKRTRP